jgi:glycosyltransferase involved in cell wall biosynthesis
VKIFFISHDASRTGGAILLLNLIQVLKESGSYEMAVLLRKGGPLEEEFLKLVKTFIWNKEVRSGKNYFKRMLQKAGNVKLPNEEIFIEIQKSDIIINNTITNGELLEVLTKEFHGKIFSYIHELRMASFRFATRNGINLTLRLSHKILTPSKSVKHYLEANYNVHSSKIFSLPYYLPNKRSKEQDYFYKEKNLDALVLGSCGTLEWRKGVDIFISVATYLKSINQLNNFKFIWKGVNEDSKEYLQCLHDVELGGLKNHLTFLPSSDEMNSFYSSIDLFFLPSREDPYPLVVLEAASYAKPTICFQDAGGAPEFVEEGGGTAVPYLDIKCVADLLLKYKNKPDLIVENGKKAKLHAEMLHQNVSSILEQFAQIVNS